MGVSFTGYLTQVRLFHAALLLQGEGTVTEIAYESGFSSASALIDAFKQYRGITPGQYRRNLGEKAGYGQCGGNEDRRRLFHGIRFPDEICG